MYEAFFGLTEAPFRLTPDPRFLYLSPKHAEALAHLRLGLTEPGGFVCITGEIGTGKTTVLRTFLADLGSEVATAYVFNPTLSWEDLLARIARELGVPLAATGHVDVMDALNAHLLAQRRDGRIAVVVIDEAQAIPTEVLERLRLLSNLETSTEKLLRLILVGQPQLARVLADPALEQLNQRITLRWHLGPLTRAETLAYVRHRLVVAGGDQGKKLFTTRALWRVHRYSKGVPRLVNMIAHRAALAAYVRRQRQVDVAAVRQAYREIRALPLSTAHTGWRLGWVASGLAVAAGVAAIGMPYLGGRAGMPAPIEQAVLAPALVPPALSTVEPPPAAIAPPVAPAIDDAELEERLARTTPAQSLRGALGTVLRGWRVAGLRADERVDPEALEQVAHQRGLEDLRLSGNLSMLRLLDLPALLELRLPGVREPYYVALTGVDDERATLALGDGELRVDPALLDRVWFGDAHVLWRDFEWLGPTFGSEAHGTNVTRLQKLLARASAYGGPANGNFDGATQTAVLGFQRSRRLDPDGRVGRLTRIALYGAAGSYPLPTLAGGGRDATASPATAAGRGPS